MVKMDNGISVPYFVLEGLDGVGKSSLMPLIAGALEDIGYSVYSIQEPPNNLDSEYLSSWLSNRPHEKSLTAIAMVQFAARIQQFATIKKRKFTEGKSIILADRSYLSTFVYQGKDIAEKLLKISDLPTYDHAFHIRVPYEVAKNRIDDRGYSDANDIVDKDQYARMASVYGSICGNMVINNVRLIAANEIVDKILEILHSMGKALPVDASKKKV